MPKIQTNRLRDIADELRQEHEKVIGTLRWTLQHAANAGGLLIEAQKLLGGKKSRKFAPWLRRNFAGSKSTAYKYISLAEAAPRLKELPADATMSEALRMLAAPAPDADAAPVDDMPPDDPPETTPKTPVEKPADADGTPVSNIDNPPSRWHENPTDEKNVPPTPIPFAMDPPTAEEYRPTAKGNPSKPKKNVPKTVAADPTTPRRSTFDIRLDELTRLVFNLLKKVDNQLIDIDYYNSTINELVDALRGYSPTIHGIDFPDWLSAETFEQFVVLRQRTRRPLTAHSAKLLIARIDGFRKEGFDANELLELAIMSGWQTVYKPKDHNGNDNGPQRTADSNEVDWDAESRAFEDGWQ